MLLFPLRICKFAQVESRSVGLQSVLKPGGGTGLCGGWVEVRQSLTSSSGCCCAFCPLLFRLWLPAPPLVSLKTATHSESLSHGSLSDFSLKTFHHALGGNSNNFKRNEV